MSETRSDLEARYCPPLDPALFSAILSDYDLTKPSDLAQARQILDDLKDAAPVQEASGFDPTGLSGLQEDTSGSSKQASSQTDETNDMGTLSADLNSVEISSATSSVAGDDKQDMTAFLEEMESQSDETKIQHLHEMFPDTRESSISLTLSKCSSNFYRAFEELLNHTYFAEDPTNAPSKSIDAFSEDHAHRRRKRKPRNKQLRDTYSADDAPLTSPSTPSTSPPSHNAWTSPHKPSKPQPTGIQIIANHLPLPSQLSASEDESTPAPKRGAPSSHHLPQSSHLSSTAQASHYAASRDAFLAQASSAYRRGKSDHLMLAAGAYYSQQSRSMSDMYRSAAGRAADELVERNSTRSSVDLHGVSVRDGVRIVNARLDALASGTGSRVRGLDGRMATEGGRGADSLKIITGIGRHSVGGRAKLEPAVRKVLEGGGWRFGYDAGVFEVWGRR